MKRAARLLGLLAALSGSGCSRGFFTAQGYVASDGGKLGGWHRTPEGCSRDPFDGRSAQDTSSVLTFVWQDPSIHDGEREKHRALVPDEPMRLEIGRDGAGFAASLATVKVPAVRIAASACRTFTLETQEQPADFAGGKPTLSGRLRMDCRVGERRVSADVQFARCSY